MAINDWNGNGRNDSADDFFEYHHVINGGGNPGGGGGHQGGGMSTIGAILCSISGLIEQAILYMLLGIEAEDVPVIVILILWIVFSFITAEVVTLFKH